jgi:hypothetical protein
MNFISLTVSMFNYKITLVSIYTGFIVRATSVDPDESEHLPSDLDIHWSMSVRKNLKSDKANSEDPDLSADLAPISRNILSWILNSTQSNNF